jgi:DNA-binding transcriptional ArsR family regulator
MGFRIYFTSADIAQTRAQAPDPLWEVLLSLHVLQTRAAPSVFDEWRCEMRSKMTDSIRELLVLARPRGYSPDFLTPSESAVGIEEGLDALACTTRARLHTDMAGLEGEVRLSGSARALAKGDLIALRDLASAIRDYYRVALSPYWAVIRRLVEADLALRSRIMLRGGFTELIATLHGTVRWNPPVLEVLGGSSYGDIHLNGRGLRLIPSFFCWRAPTKLSDPDLPPVLVYPIERSGDALRKDAACLSRERGNALPALLGHTRAAVLEAAAGGCSTTELARRVGISLATASEHARILREAGLITTHRTGCAVKHVLSERGLDLLGGSGLLL